MQNPDRALLSEKPGPDNAALKGRRGGCFFRTIYWDRKRPDPFPASQTHRWSNIIRANFQTWQARFRHNRTFGWAGLSLFQDRLKRASQAAICGSDRADRVTGSAKPKLRGRLER
jgi:hypothetical protein